jgi:hypothetical protein
VGEVVGKRILEAVAFAQDARATHFDLAPPELPDGARASGREGYATFRNVGTGLLPCGPNFPTEIGDDFR